MNEMKRKILTAVKNGEIVLPQEKFVKAGKVFDIFNGYIGKSTVYWLMKSKRVESYKISGEGTSMVNVHEIFDYFTKRD